ncbi:serine protease, S1-C subfamily, contains C-terminal PDZ domain [Streptosporangium subroseum]|uniref:Serine protease, S1-C subfamily, contains C-terminal PDZ domain n=1 Tax=Streptosporangium subroseum TaxID=106412 RepID=A0A239NYQ8_9ACTN|nr:serine protease, S1-C subfamily, contains C-terminal PDZ domain [Streptosporangium subroseum]
MGESTSRVALLAAAAMMLAGCGPGVNSPPADIFFGTPTATPTVTPTASPSGSPSGSPSTSPSRSAEAAPGAVALETAYERVIAKVLPSIVQITTANGLGSGIVYDRSGHIITNAHVVGRANQFKVTLATGSTPRTAKLVESFGLGDLAVIKVDDPEGLTPAVFGDSSKLRVGQIVLAMGNPLGLSGSVTNGIVSALGRTVSEPQDDDPEDEGSPGATITGAIQTSAAINPGNSGGALVNLSGEVIGIPTLAALNPELGGGAAPGIGFAIPSNTATDIATQIVKDGKVTNTHRAALGVTVQTVIGIDGRTVGVGVVRVSRGSGASRAGVRVGDVIISINNVRITGTQALSELLATLNPGDQAKVQLLRPNGSTSTVTVTLGELPSS